MYDVIIIGSGPAGISAALYLLRANYKVLIISNGISALEKAHLIDNYYGFPKSVSGKELYENGINQAKRLGADFIKGEVTAVDYNGVFSVSFNNNTENTSAVIFATGASRKKPKILNYDIFEGRGISNCAICDAFFFRNKKVCVLGSGDYALHEADVLSRVTKDITILTNGENQSFSTDVNYKIDNRKVSGVAGNLKLEKIIFDDDSEVKTDGLFIAQGVAGSAQFALKLGLPTENGVIITDKEQQTAIPGVFAAGDCTGSVLQISTAVGEGAVAGLSAIKFLRTKK